MFQNYHREKDLQDKLDKNFLKPISEELIIFQKKFNESMKSKVGLVDLITRYILKQKGKKIRPTLVLLVAKMLGEINERTYRGATLVELLHSATLIHDDVVDSAEKRRGLASINTIWKNKVAVLIGDYLLARGLMLAVENKDFDFLQIITNTVKRMSEGELLQIQKSRRMDNDEETYFKIISDKTASLISTCTQIGALSVSDKNEDLMNFKNFGENIGIAFQIHDDILDFDGTSSIIGKPIGADLREKKITLPLLFAFKNAGNSEVTKIKRMLNRKLTNDRIEIIIDFVKRNGGLDYAIEREKYFANLALNYIKDYEDSESKSALIDLVNFIIARRN
ncbi:MAG: polyprenyl synthetase family protein [Ignavibacteria bacterium]|nr:polyprenyl synthetase family protein [Ignavibacteria bacterium]